MVDLILEKPTVCRYCGNPVVFTSNAEIYGRIEVLQELLGEE